MEDSRLMGIIKFYSSFDGLTLQPSLNWQPRFILISRLTYIIIVWTFFGNCTLAQSQIVPDNTMGNESSQVRNNVNINELPSELIEGGAQREDNLFHSFSQFNIEAGQGAYFANPEGIANIFSRVTGNDVSNILGTLGVNGTADLFLINPNGIIFGENASLDVNGSFVGSTAQSLIFGNNFEFSAVNPESPPLLTINTSLGLQFGENPGDITVNNNGHSLSLSDSSPIERIILPGLEVKSGKTLALIGRNIFLEGGFLGANGGNIELGAIGSNDFGSTVELNLSSDSWRFDYGKNSNLGEIKLQQKSFLDSSGDDNGSINLVGKNISIEDGSIVLIQTQNSGGDNFDNKINIEASETFTISETTEDGEFLSNITSETLGSGSGEDIVINAKNLFFTGRGQIEAKSFGTGNAANITINVIESTNIEGDSSIESLGFGRGDAGVINLTTEKLSIIDSATISSASLAGTGNSGDVTITARDSVQVIGLLPDNNVPSVISSSTLTEGDGGNLTINTGRLLLKGGGRIDASAFSSGNAGNVVINASEFVEVNGESEDPISPSLIIASANVLDENIRALFGLPDQPSGDSGSVTVNTPELRIIDGGSVTVQNDGIGKGGTININGDRALLTKGGSISASTLSGQGGNITIDLEEQLVLRQASSISAEADGIGNGGNIDIDAGFVVAFPSEGSNGNDIVANAVQGQGGNIDISTQGIFGIKSSKSLTPLNDITASSQLGIDGEVNINTTIDFSNSFELINPKFLVAEEALRGSCFTRRHSQQGSFVYGGAGGLPVSPSSAIDEEKSLSSQLPEVSINSETFHPSGKGSNHIPSFAEATIYPAQTAERWQVGEPIIEPTNLIKTADGRSLWVKKQANPASSLICQ